MAPVLNRSAAKNGVIAYQDKQDSNLFHYLPARIDAVMNETLREFAVKYYGISTKPYFVDFGNGRSESVVGGILSGKAVPDITEQQRGNILEEITKVFQVQDPHLVPLEVTGVKVQPIFARSITEMGERSNADFPSTIKFGSAFNYQVASGNSLFAELVGSSLVGQSSTTSPEFAVNFNGMATFYGDPWKARIRADLKQVWEYVRSKVDVGAELGWFNLGVQTDDITQSLINEGVVEIEYLEGTGGQAFGRQLLETTKALFEGINKQVVGGEGFFKFAPNPDPQPLPEGDKKSLGASLLPWTVSVNVTDVSNTFSQSIMFTETISFTGTLEVPVAGSMTLALPCSSGNVGSFYDLQDKRPGCITAAMSEGLQKRIAAERKAKNVYLATIRESLLNGKINLETYKVLVAEANTISYTETLGADGISLVPAEEMLERAKRRIKALAEA